MSQWRDIRRSARERHARWSGQSGSPVAAQLLAAAADTTGICCLPVRAKDALLGGAEAVLDHEQKVIWYNAEVSPETAAFYQAHEYAHHCLGHGGANCLSNEIDMEASEERVPLGVQRVEGYGPRERRECQANVFARELLLPADQLRRWFLGDNLKASAIARRVGVPDSMVRYQLAEALLIEPERDTSEPTQLAIERDSSEPELDHSQQVAAHTEHGPFLVDAGPGTGKTKTLVGRICHLLTERNVPAPAILALTFSNKAAEEMRGRVARAAPEAAPLIWMGTFHAFGLELLRKYGDRLGYPADPQVLDPADTIFLLERLLPSLGLVHYRDLAEPTRYLRDFLQAISRAKDELAGPDRYLALAQAMRARATSDEAIEAAGRALEVAHVYDLYQAKLEEAHQLDFSDLIWKAVVLLQNFPDVRSLVQQQYQHILVDEYQDVNRASGVLLREIAGAGDGLWAVGDARQSIYRFRGAAPRNVREFEEDFPGARAEVLERNYRSQPPIVDVIATLAPQMLASRGRRFRKWEADRAIMGGAVSMEVAADLVSEAAGLATEIWHQREGGVPFRNQAVLCRSHTSLSRLASLLEEMEIPVLYLGDIFERPEVRDLLALISLAGGPDGRGLLRVAEFPEYRILQADVLELLRLASEHQVPFPAALELAEGSATITAAGQAGLARLRMHLDDITYGMGPAGFLAYYLFERSDFLRPLLADSSLAGKQRRMAIFQFLQYAHEQREVIGETGLEAKRRFLSDVRRLEIFGEEKQLRQAPAWADQLDAVRLMTIHASKGLEFSVIYLPILGQRYFPLGRRYDACPLPPGLAPDTEADEQAEEEECLFFVALSRARDTLVLSRAERYGAQNSNPSKLLNLIAGTLSQAPDGKTTWPATTRGLETPASSMPAPTEPLVFEAHALDQYILCPHQYYAEHVLGLSGRREDSAYVQFHRSVYAVLRWLSGEQASGRTIDNEEAQRKLAEIWLQQGPRDHAYEAIYRESAAEMVSRALQPKTGSLGPGAPEPYEVPLGYGRVKFTPDHVDRREGGTEVFQRLRTGRISSTEKNRNLYALYQWAATRRGSAVEIVSLSSDATEPVELSDRSMQTRLGAYDQAMAGILAGDFSPNPSDHVCPRCPHYFICPISLQTPNPEVGAA